MPQLAMRAVVPQDLAVRLAGLSGFRNILVHEYGAVDFGLVYDKLRDLQDLHALAGALERWLSAQEPGG